MGFVTDFALGIENKTQVSQRQGEEDVEEQTLRGVPRPRRGSRHIAGRPKPAERRR